jgi:hypothetical protein
LTSHNADSPGSYALTVRLGRPLVSQ